jgi:hypothetical protein
MKRILLALLCAAVSSAADAQLKPPADKPKPAAKSKQQKLPTTIDDEANVKAVQKIFECVAEGLPTDWRQARVVITEMSSAEKQRSFEGRFEYSTEADGSKPTPLKPCDSREVAQGVYGLNEFLSPERRRWKVATLTFTSEGKFEIKYDYVR